MKKKTKITLGVLGGVLFIVLAYYTTLLWIVGDFVTAALSPPPKPPIGIVGVEMNPDTQQNYNFICRASGLDFPHATQVDIYDTGFDIIVACFTLPTNGVNTFLTENHIGASALTDVVAHPAIKNLTAYNQSLPTQISTLDNQTTNRWDYPIKIYCDLDSRRIWVECHYRGWSD